MYPKRNNTYGVSYPLPERDRTHWNGCWRSRSHHSCAVALVEKMAGWLRHALEVDRDGDRLTDAERTEMEKLLSRVEE